MYKIICNGIDTVSDRVEISVLSTGREKKVVRLKKIDCSNMKNACDKCFADPINCHKKQCGKTGKTFQDICYNENIIFELVK